MTVVKLIYEITGVKCYDVIDVTDLRKTVQQSDGKSGNHPDSRQ